MHIESCEQRMPRSVRQIALSRDAAAFANGQDADYGGDAPDPDANYEWEDD
jgi:hypothetical protein